MIEQCHLGREVVAKSLMIGIAHSQECFQIFGQRLLVLQIPCPCVDMAIDASRNSIKKTVLPVNASDGCCALQKREHSFELSFVESLCLLAYIVTNRVSLGRHVVLVAIGIMVAVEAQLQTVFGRESIRGSGVPPPSF